MPATTDDGRPILKAAPRKDGKGLKVFCRYCNRWHAHGNGEGHRLAHCAKNTPYTKTGYVLRKDPYDWPDE